MRECKGKIWMVGSDDREGVRQEQSISIIREVTSGA